MTKEHKYSTYCDGIYTNVYTTDEIIRAIKQRNEDNLQTINRLEEENEKLKEEIWKDEELQKMRQELEDMREEYYRGFPISKKEDESIKEWIKEHEAKVHGLDTLEKRMKAAGVSGGGYTYKFYPTAIGTSGEIICNRCGELFEFCGLG